MPRKRSPIAEVLGAFASACEPLRLDWYLFGAQAALLYGSARLTADVDVTVVGEIDGQVLAAAVRERGFSLRITDPTFLTRTRVLPIVHQETRLPVDVVLGGPGLEDLIFSRALTRNFAGVTVRVISAEDLVVLKLLAGRDKDLGDIEAVLRAQSATLDVEQLRGTLSSLEEALGQSDLSPLLDHFLRKSGVER